MSYTDIDDAELIRLYARGEQRAFDEIVNRYERTVYAVAARMCGPQDAADVVQDVFINALRALPRFRGDAQLSTWLHRVTVNASLDHLRKRKRPVTPIDAVPERADAAPGPEERAVAAARAAAVQRALQEITPEHRAVLVLVDLQGRDYAEVAAILDIPVGTVKSRVHRARLELASRLGHLRAEPDRAEDPLRKRT